MIFRWALGAHGGALLTTALLIFDPLSFWPLIHDSGAGLPAIFLLYVGFVASCGGLVCASSVMFPPSDDVPRAGAQGGMRRRLNWRGRETPPVEPRTLSPAAAIGR
jgi:hypothetical protein